MNRGEIIGAMEDCGASFPHLSDLEECVVAIQALAKSERERCAKLADDEFGDLTVLGDGIYNQLGDARRTAQNIAAAIRALGGE